MMDLDNLEHKITDKTTAIIAVHLFGQTLNMTRIEEIARIHNLALIEDAAQSLGAHYNGKKAGSLGMISCISFDPTKVIGAFGNGGVMLTDNCEVYEAGKKYHYHGKNLQTGDFEILGYNSRMASSQASLLNLQLDWIGNWIKQRNHIATIYTAELGNVDDIILPLADKGSNHIYHKYVIRVKQKRDELKSFLSERKIKTMIHYNKPLFDNPVFLHHDYYADNIHNVYKIIKEVLSLPIYPFMTDKEAHYVTDSINKFIQK